VVSLTKIIPAYEKYNRQKCMIGYSHQAEWADDLLAACHEVLSKPEIDLEIDYANKYLEPNKTLIEKSVELIANARFGIYDLSYWRPSADHPWRLPSNVYIELGIAIGLNRPTLLLWNEKNTKASLSLPKCLESIRDKIVFWSGTTTLKNALEKILPSWIEISPSDGWYDRYCYFGGRICEYRELHPSAFDWRNKVIECHTSDGNDVDKVDFREIVNKTLDHFTDISHKYIDELSLVEGYQFQVCSYCQTLRRSPVAVYRITKDTSPETYLSIGISIAVEAQSDNEIYRILLADSSEDVPSLLKGYDIIEAPDDKSKRARLHEFIPQIKKKIRKVSWKSQPLPFIAIESISSHEGESNPSSLSREIRILVVNDNDIQRERLASILRQSGWIVTETSTNEDAFKKLKHGKYTLVITDANRKPERYGEDGYQGLELAVQIQDKIPTIIFSGLNEDHLRNISPLLGNVKFIERSFSDQQLTKIIGETISSIGQYSYKGITKHILISFNPTNSIATSYAALANDHIKAAGFDTWVSFEHQSDLLGASWAETIKPVIQKSSHLVAIYTQQQSESQAFEHEIRAAMDLHIPIIVVVSIDTNRLPLYLEDSATSIIDITQYQNWQDTIVSAISSVQTASEVQGKLQQSLELSPNIEADFEKIKKYALLIGNSEYNDSTMNLKSPKQDVQALASVLKDSSVGNFDEVQVLENATIQEMRVSIEKLFRRSHDRNDLIFLYYSGHSAIDANRELYLVAKDTQYRDLLSATGLDTAYLRINMKQARSQRQILLLDTSNAGAITSAEISQLRDNATSSVISKAESSKEYLTGSSDGIGYGQYILTSSSALEMAYESIKDGIVNSFFTHFLVEGLSTGNADINQDGYVDVIELYEYVSAKMRDAINHQQPHFTTTNARGRLIITKNPHYKKDH
jgi:CheY-like chemotaxis protein